MTEFFSRMRQMYFENFCGSVIFAEFPHSQDTRRAGMFTKTGFQSRRYLPYFYT